MSSSRLDLGQVGGAVLDLDLLGQVQARAQADRHVVGDVDAADRQHGGVIDRAVDEDRDVGRAAADVGHEHAELLLGIGQGRLGRGQRADDHLVDLDAGADRRTCDRFWTDVAAPATMWVSTSSRTALIPSGSLIPSWPSTM